MTPVNQPTFTLLRNLLLSVCVLGAANAYADTVSTPPAAEAIRLHAPRVSGAAPQPAPPQTLAAHDWLEQEYGHIARQESLRDILYDFAAAVSVPAIISAKVNTYVSGDFATMKARDFLTDIVKTYDLSWVYDGVTLHVYHVSELEQKTLELPYMHLDAFQQYMQSLDIQGAPLNWKIVPTQNIIHLAGPPRFVELVAEIVARFAEVGAQTSAVDHNQVVRIFHIKYGYIGREIAMLDDTRPAANLVETLSRIMNAPYGITGVTKDKASASRRRKHSEGEPLLGKGLNAETAPPAARAVDAGLAAGKNEPYILGDARLNAIIVRDQEQRMPIYEQLIKQLDKPLDQIDIEVTILDIDRSRAESLGVQWRSEFQEGEFDVGINTAALSVTSAREIITRITALQERNESRIMERPSVVTLDNHEAVFQNNHTFYVRLGNERSSAVDLVPVSYGLDLKVLPHVIYESGKRKIRLNVHVEDGQRSANSSVTEVPEITQSLIQTQAVIEENQSLLLGGYNVREYIEGRTRIPGLGHIPVIGLLFSSKMEDEQFFERYFLITPRIISAEIEYEINTGFKEDRKEPTILRKPGAQPDQVSAPAAAGDR